MRSGDIACFFLEPTDVVKHEIHWSDDTACPALVGRLCVEIIEDPLSTQVAAGNAPPIGSAATGVCSACGRARTWLRKGYSPGAPYYRRSDTGELGSLWYHSRVGAMWDAALWLPKEFVRGLDGRHLCVNTPGGPWEIDSRASNCDMKDDDVHRCWVRHGVPPKITCDKAGLTCHAGAGSIQAGNWHGYLRDGYLTLG